MNISKTIHPKWLKWCWLLYINLFSLLGYSQIEFQNLTYQVLDEKLAPIPNVSIHFIDHMVLSATDLSGNFSFPTKLHNLTPEDSISFSAVGYETEITTIADLMELGLVILNEKKHELQEVVVSAKKSRIKYATSGNKRYSDMFYQSWYPHYSYQEKVNNYQIAKHLSFKQDSLFLDRLNFHVHSSSSDSAEFIVEIFEYSNHPSASIGKRLHPAFSKSISIKAGWNEINLTNHLLKIPGDVWVSIQFVPKNWRQPLFYLSSTFFSSHDSAIKPIEDEDWVFIKTNTSIYGVGRKIRRD